MRGQENLVVIKSNLLALKARERREPRCMRQSHCSAYCFYFLLARSSYVSQHEYRSRCFFSHGKGSFRHCPIHRCNRTIERRKEQAHTSELAAHSEEQLSHRLRSIIETLLFCVFADFDCR